MTESLEAEGRAQAEMVLRTLFEPRPPPGPDCPYKLNELLVQGVLPATEWSTRECIRFGLPLTDDMKRLTIKALDEQRQCRSDQEKTQLPNSKRNAAILYAIVAVECVGFKPTRNVASEHKSACDIVSEVLRDFGIELEYRAVAKIWENYKKALAMGEAIANGERPP